MDKDDYNVDVQITFDNEDIYTATFFTLKNLQSLFNKNKLTGECSDGLYLYCVDMVLVEELTVENIEQTISDLIKNKDLEYAFDFYPKQAN